MKKKNSIVKVNLDTIRHNLDVIGSYLGDGVKQMAVVKADAYGHGLIEVAGAAGDKAAWLAVNDIDEAIEIREAGLKTPILVFEVPQKNSVQAYRYYNLTATISSPDHFILLPEGTQYHLNIDTGMGRLGIPAEQLPDVRRLMSESNELSCTGIYSHFATADEPGSALAARQLTAFKNIRARFKANLLTHMCNTGGSAFYPEAHFDMVRTGIGMYGYAPGATGIPGLKPALTWETEIVLIRKIKKGTPVSYGAVWKAPEDGYVGVLPVGYEDGLRRNLSGNLGVKIGKSTYPVVGRVTMNYCIVYLGKELPVHHNDPVSLLDGQTLTASVWAEQLQTIPYEVLTGISNRIPRVYS